MKRALQPSSPREPSTAQKQPVEAASSEGHKETWIEGSKRIKANPPRPRTIPREWKEKVTPEYALAQVAKVGGVNILQDERNKHISWRKVARTIETDLQLRPRGNCNQILKKMVEDATGLDLRQRVSQVVGDCAFVVRRRGKNDNKKQPKQGAPANNPGAPAQQAPVAALPSTNSTTTNEPLPEITGAPSKTLPVMTATTQLVQSDVSAVPVAVVLCPSNQLLSAQVNPAEFPDRTSVTTTAVTTMIAPQNVSRILATDSQRALQQQS